MNLDFLKPQQTEFKEPDEIYHGPNLKGVNKMTRREFTQGVLNVYQQLGGDTWLLQQAKIDPKSFLDMLKKIIPTNMNLDDIAGLQINLIDRYGNRAEITKDNLAAPPTVTSPHLERQGESVDSLPPPRIVNRFDSSASSKNRTVARNSPDFDFTV